MKTRSFGSLLERTLANLSIVMVFFCTLSAYGETYQIYFNQNDFVVDSTNGLLHVIAPSNYSEVAESNWPDVPVKPIKVVAPYGNDVIDFNVSVQKKLVSSGVPMAQRGASVPSYWIQENPEEEEISSEAITDAVVAVEGITGLSGRGVKEFIVYPFLYEPVSKKLYFVENIELNITWGSTDSWEIRSIFDDIDLNTLDGVYSKAENERTYPQNKSQLQRSISPMQVWNAPTTYLIITNEEMVPYFEVLARWRTSTGVTTEVVTIESLGIDVTDKEWGPKELKDYIYDRYKGGVRYVMLAASTDIVPTILCYAKVEYKDKNGKITGTETSNIACDWYYASFDKDFYWDANNNKIYGEKDDNIDYIPDLTISRLPISDADEAQTYVLKVFQYESMGPRQNEDPVFLFAGSQLSDDASAAHDSYNMAKQIFKDNVSNYWPYEVKYLFECGDISGKSFNVNNFVGCVNEEPDYVFVNCHGNVDRWKTDQGPLFYSSDVDKMHNVILPFHGFTGACLTAKFTDSNCLGKALVASEGGAIDYLGSADLAFAKRDGSIGTAVKNISYAIGEVFKANDTYRTTSLAEALRKTKINFSAECNNKSLEDIWSHYSINVIGEPLVTTYIGGDNFKNGREIKASIKKTTDKKKVIVELEERPDNPFLIVYVDYSKREPVVTHYQITGYSLELPTTSNFTIGIISKNYRPVIYKEGVRFMSNLSLNSETDEND